jgi:ABC-type multidrug transport system fused ATPase/permease subunit
LPPHALTSDSSYNSKSFLGIFRYSVRAVQLVWATSPALTLTLVFLSLCAGLVPAAIAYVGKWLVDAVILTAQMAGEPGSEVPRAEAIRFVLIEAGLVTLMAALQRGLHVCQSLLRALLGNRVNVMILEKALTLDLTLFEDSEFYDKMTRARRQASSRPLSLVIRTFGLIQNAISLVTYGALLLNFSPIAVVILALAALPTFFAETKYSGEAFRLFRWRTPEARQQMYLETVIAREDYAKEVKLFGLGSILLDRYQEIFKKLYKEDRSLTIRRGVWGYLLGLLSTAAFYGSYGWIVFAAMDRQISIGEMTMYVMVFKQGQSALSAALSSIGGMYEDNLYLSNLYEYLEQEVPSDHGTALKGPTPGDGLRFEGVSFAYPGSDENAVEDISFHLEPGTKLALVGENGSGKTTIIKLLTRLYQPSKGRITLDGLDLQEFDDQTLRNRLGVIFQDFVHYQFKVGENIGVGDQGSFDDEEAWRVAAKKGMAAPFIEELPDQYQTQLGRWFKGGRELSLGQWQKIALSRAFVRKGADIVVLDEPTASMDAAAEAQIFEHFREITQDQMAIVISHRFSTVRMADDIIVLHRGHITEHGSHDDLIAADQEYAKLFEMQAKGYQ